MGQAPVLNYIDHLIELVKTEKVVLDDIISHTLPLSEVTRGYEIFDKKEGDCVKVVLKPWEQRKETEIKNRLKLKSAGSRKINLPAAGCRRFNHKTART